MTKDEQAVKYNFFYHPLTAWTVLTISIIVTIYLFFLSKQYLEKESRNKFLLRAQEITQAIENRMNAYEAFLHSGVGLFVASENVTREEWRAFVENLKMDQYWPGVQGMGYAIPVSPLEKQEHVAQIQAEGFPNYDIRPQGVRKQYSAIIYLEPFDWRNQRAFGYDMWSSEVRREAMIRARNTGQAATSGLITLVQETDQDVQTGFLTHLPVYQSSDIPLDTVEARRKYFKGWVYSPFRMNDLMKGILGEGKKDINFEIYDGSKMDSRNLLYDSNEISHVKQEFKSEHTNIVEVILQGRKWTIYFESVKQPKNNFEKKQPIIMAVGGALINFLFFYAFYSLSSIHKKANKIAQEMNRELMTAQKNLEIKVLERTQDLEAVKESLEQQVQERTKELEHRMNDLERTNRLMIGRENRMIELKEKIKELRELLRQQNE